VDSQDRKVNVNLTANARGVDRANASLLHIPQFAGRPRKGAVEGGGSHESLLRIILEKGKPVARPGRKARGQPPRRASTVSPVAEGMFDVHKTRMHIGQRGETHPSLF
jgi:hypothetical protein